ncbi:MAG: glycosyltransferase family 4 protein [Pseudomonadota bacterium]
MHICIVQPFIPHYSIAFFNALAQLPGITKLTVLADIESQTQLNQAGDTKTFELKHLTRHVRHGFEMRPGRWAAIRDVNPDICVLSGNPRDLGSLWVSIGLRLKGIKTYHWGMFHRIGGPRIFTQFVFWLFGRLAHGCLSYSETGARNLLAIGCPAQKLTTVGTAIDEQAILPFADALTAEDCDRFKHSQGLDGKHILLQVVRLSAIKQPTKLIDVAQVLRSKGRDDFVLICIGGGDMFDVMRQKVEDHALHDVIRILPPIYEEQDLAPWFKSATAFTIPSCIGLSAHHAFAYGVPVVTDRSLTQQASEAAILADGLNAILYDPDDMHDYACALEYLMDNPQDQRRLGENARATVTQNASLAAKTRRFAAGLNLAP